MNLKYAVLFIDDEASILDSLKRGLTGASYKCFYAQSKKEADDILLREKISVVVCDIRMPDVDGVAYLKEIKTTYPNIVRVLLSGYTQLLHTLTTTNQLDVFKFITKPWKSDEDYKEVIRQSLEFYTICQENESMRAELISRNQAYQNIMSNIQEVFDSTCFCTDLLGTFGKEVMAFNRKRMKGKNPVDETLMQIQENLFGLLSGAIAGKPASISEDELVKKMLAALQSRVRVTDIRKEIHKRTHIKVNLKLMEVLMLCCAELFEMEFTACGVWVVVEDLIINNEEILSISMSVPNAYVAHSPIKSIGLEAMENKVDFTNNAFGSIAEISHTDFRCTEANGNIVVVLNIKGVLV